MSNLRMPNLREISRLEFFHDGGQRFLGVVVPFSKTWTLQGFDSDNRLICSVGESDRHNYLKYVRFIIELEKNGYKMRKEDRMLLKSGAKDFLIRSYISRASRKDMYEITDITKTRHQIDSIGKQSRAVQNDFAELNGLEYDELQEGLKHWHF